MRTLVVTCHRLLLGAALFVAAPAFAQDMPEEEPTAPEGWTCTPGYYGSDDGCDCGCGVPDPDCPAATADVCDYDYCDGGDVVADDNTQCTEPVPPAEGWSCTPSYYDAGDGCDCGCGAIDPDCETETVESCDYDGCEVDETADPADITQCIVGEDDYGSGFDDDPGDDTPGDDTPGDDTPSDDTPSDDTPSDDSPSDDTPSDDTPGDTGSDGNTPGDNGAPGDLPGDDPGDTGGTGGLGDPPSNDDDGAVEDDPPEARGGCDASGGQDAPLALALVLGVMLLRRRRR